MLKLHLLNLAYRLRHHCVGSRSLDLWGVILTWLVAALLLAGWLLRGRPELPLLHWALLAVLGLGGVALLVLRWFASRRGFVVFSPEPASPPPAPRPLDPADKVALRASGRFEVAGRSASFSGLNAYWRTFASREHAIMAILHPSRWLLLGNVPASLLGMWYIFFRPEDVIAVVAGRLAVPGGLTPALRVDYRWIPPAVEGSRPPMPSVVSAYLAFDGEPARDVVWADLAADRGMDTE